MSRLAHGSRKIESEDLGKGINLLTLNKLSPVGTIAGESAGICLVNSSAKLLVSNSLTIFGLNGVGTFFLAKSSQLIPSKN